MTREEKQKAIDALKISAPVMAVTQEEFNNYIQTINKIMDWLEQEPNTGRWWERDTYPQECKCWDCSECQETVFERTNYCPNCGAKMTEIPTGCSTCILDNTDACTRGAGRAIDDEACEEYLGAESEKE